MTNLGVCHDWLDGFGGAERQIEQIIVNYPSAELYTTFDLRRGNEAIRLPNTIIHTSWLNMLPFVEFYYRSLLLLAMRSAESFDVRKHDVILSVSSAISKGIITGANQPHIAYVNSPARYAWDMQHDYLDSIEGKAAWLKRLIAKELLHRFRTWDVRTANGVDTFLANSKFIQRRIWKTYRRRSNVLYPPVDTTSFSIGSKARDSYYVTASRMVPYKQIPLIAKAFSRMPDKKLIVIGDGPEMASVKQHAGPNIEILGYQSSAVMLDYFQRAKAFIFAANEDFGIVPLEAQACGTPVVALNAGGTAETIQPFGLTEKPTGVLFDEQTVNSLINAVNTLDSNYSRFDPEYCRDNALRFSNERFSRELRGFVSEAFNQRLKR